MIFRKSVVGVCLIFWCVCLVAEAQDRLASSLRVLPLGESILIPIGRSFINRNKIEIRINDKTVLYKKIYDGYGGYWAKVFCNSLGEYSIIKVRYTRHRETVSTYRHEPETVASWTIPSFFINSENNSIRKKARKIYNDTLTIEENVSAISDFVTGHIKFKRGFHRAPASIKASQTLLQREGVCINFSRLFIALCRASGIAARSISGIVLSKEHPDKYDFGHEWVEYMDEDGHWHPLDLTYTITMNLSDIRYTDLVYAAEDHAYFSAATNKSLKAGRPFSLENNDIVLFHYHPIFPGAKFGFKLIEDHRPEYFVVEKAIGVVKRGNQIFIQQNLESPIASIKKYEDLDELIELNTEIEIKSEPEYSEKKIIQVPKWLKKYNGKMFTYKRRMFRTKEIKLETNYKKNEIFLTEYDGKKEPTRYQLGLSEHHLANKTRPGMLMGTKATFKKNMLIVDIAVPKLGWRAKGTYLFSGNSVELSVIELNGNKYFTKGFITK